MTDLSVIPDENAWRKAHFRSLLDFATASPRADGGARWLDDDGRPDETQPVYTWITSRMTHCFAVGALLGVEGMAARADHALGGLRTALHDSQWGGWVAAIGKGPAGEYADDSRFDGTKAAYAHAFVVLAAASAAIAERPGADHLLDQALDVLDRRFWDPEQRMLADESSRDWSVLAQYRGVNANMHGVEAMLAAYDATGDVEWLSRAESIVDRVLNWARQTQWRIPEHFDDRWTPLPEFNADRPRDPFKPYGSTPGHGLEWARLAVQTDAARREHASGDAEAGPGRLAAAKQLFARAVEDGWDADAGGFVYTVDWHGVPVEPRRFHWVAAEAVATADVLARSVPDQAERTRYAALGSSWWDYIRRYLVDDINGSWHHELDVDNRPSPQTWVGKPDIYHAAQATILPLLPIAGSIAGAARAAGPIVA